MRVWTLSCAVLVLALAAGGCAYQRADVVSEQKPDWVLHKPADTPQKLYFVGTALGPGIVDTAHARSTAMQDVCRQIAGALEPVAVEQAIAIADQKGIPHSSRQEECAAYAATVRQQVQGACSAVQQDDFYWERWAYKPGMFNSVTYQYRYHILASMTPELRDKLITELAHKIADDMQAQSKSQAAAASKPVQAPASP